VGSRLFPANVHLELKSRVRESGENFYVLASARSFIVNIYVRKNFDFALSIEALRKTLKVRERTNKMRFLTFKFNLIFPTFKFLNLVKHKKYHSSTPDSMLFRCLTSLLLSTPCYRVKCKNSNKWQLSSFCATRCSLIS
jgi:hypothetical protein